MAVRMRFTPFAKSPRRRRVLFTIAHYFRASAHSVYGSTHAAAIEDRRQALVRTIASLHQVVAQPQALFDGPSGGFKSANAADETEIDVVVCTAGDAHLLEGLPLPPGSFVHRRTRCEPLFLGYECHAVLAESIGRYDWYCYLEDDIAIEDSLFMTKLAWFAGWAGADAVLQPNRFESSNSGPLRRLYIDGDPVKPELLGSVPDTSDRTWLSASALGRELWFGRFANAHSGTFFLTAAQMQTWAAKPDFLRRETAFAGPLESAATLGLVRHFRVYKPARQNAAFLEVRHLHNRYLGVLIDVVPA